MQYLPVAFAVFQFFFLLGLVIYYMAQAILRILQQAYITRAFYGHEEALGRQAQRAGEQARELAKTDGETGGGGLFRQARRDLTAAKTDRTATNATSTKLTKASPVASNGAARPSKRTTEPKNRPTPTGRGPAGRPKRVTDSSRPGGARAKNAGGKRRR